ncbi:hypothetical protein [Bradyrhizobium genosp. L]|nr:hypothetical protein [Bradyrhizobium genosp. L]
MALLIEKIIFVFCLLPLACEAVRIAAQVRADAEVGRRHDP